MKHSDIPMTPDEFAERMRVLRDRPRGLRTFDTTWKMDMLVLGLLNHLGYSEGAAIWDTWKTYPGVRSSQ